VACVLVALCLTYGLCRVVKIDKKLGLLIGIGTAICGGSAIVVAAPIIGAAEHETALSITVITLFGLLAIFLYPVIGHLLHMNQWAFGVWAGTAIQAVPQVVATGFIYGHKAGEISTIVKLVRVLLLAPVIMVISYIQSKEKAIKTRWTSFVPPFILGFLLLVIASSLGLFHDFTIDAIRIQPIDLLSKTSAFLITMAMAAIGLRADIKKLVSSGAKPLFVGFSAAIILAVFSQLLIRLF